MQCVSLPRFVFHTVEDTLIGNWETSEIKRNINEEFTLAPIWTFLKKNKLRTGMDIVTWRPYALLTRSISYLPNEHNAQLDLLWYIEQMLQSLTRSYMNIWIFMRSACLNNARNVDATAHFNAQIVWKCDYIVALRKLHVDFLYM